MAKFEEDLEVTGHVKVSGTSEVFGNFGVSGDARVGGTSEVLGNFGVAGDARVGGKLLLNPDTNEQIDVEARILELERIVRGLLGQ